MGEVVMDMQTRLDMARAKAEQGNWYPACGGTETPFLSRSGRRLLYCFQPSSGAHTYIDVSTDMVLTEDEAANALQLW
jgi:hypothetical protein